MKCQFCKKEISYLEKIKNSDEITSNEKNEHIVVYFVKDEIYFCDDCKETITQKLNKVSIEIEKMK